jgi:hypothetical protein
MPVLMQLTPTSPSPGLGDAVAPTGKGGHLDLQMSDTGKHPRDVGRHGFERGVVIGRRMNLPLRRQA